MKTPTIPNLSLIPAGVSALLQAGAQLFAVAVVVGTVTKAPPRSLAMYAGEDGYNSGPFVQAARWHLLDWASWVLTLSTGVVLAASLAIRVPDTAR